MRPRRCLNNSYIYVNNVFSIQNLFKFLTVITVGYHPEVVHVVPYGTLLLFSALLRKGQSLVVPKPGIDTFAQSERCKRASQLQIIFSNHTHFRYLFISENSSPKTFLICNRLLK